MSDEEQKEVKEGEEDYWAPFGYRAWRLIFRKGEPRLSALGRTGGWEPEIGFGEDPETGESVPTVVVKSDWPGEEKDPWDKSTHGLYMLKTREELKSQFAPAELYGIVYPYGKVREGPIGYRAQKAKVAAIGRWYIACYICGHPARYYIHNFESFPLCEKHLKFVEKKVREKGYTTEEVEAIIKKLAAIYDASVLYEEP